MEILIESTSTDFLWAAFRRVLWLNDGGLRLIDVQIEGKGRQSFADWRNGTRPEASERFGAPPNKDRGA